MAPLARSTGVAGVPLVELIIAEPLDHSGAASLAALLTGAIEVGARRVVVDLSDCPFIDDAGLTVVRDGHRRLNASGCRLEFRSASSCPRTARQARAAAPSETDDRWNRELRRLPILLRPVLADLGEASRRHRRVRSTWPARPDRGTNGAALGRRS
jgi:anti-anti-sigma regulatory factor